MRLHGVKAGCKHPAFTPQRPGSSGYSVIIPAIIPFAAGAGFAVIIVAALGIIAARVIAARVIAARVIAAAVILAAVRR